MARSSNRNQQEETGRQVVRMVHPINSPELKKFSRLAIAEFKVEYEYYSKSADSHGVTKRMEMECVDPNLLGVLAIQYLRKEIGDLTNEDVKVFLEKRLAIDTHFTEASIEKIFKDLKMDLTESDPTQRVIDYNVSYLKRVSAHGMQKLLEHIGFRKQVVGILLNGVKPESLRKLMRQKTKTTDARDDPREFFSLLEFWAPLQDVFHMEQSRTDRYVRERTIPRHSKRHPLQTRREDASI